MPKQIMVVRLVFVHIQFSSMGHVRWGTFYCIGILWWNADQMFGPILLCLQYKHLVTADSRRYFLGFSVWEEFILIQSHTNVLTGCKTGNLKHAYLLWMKMVTSYLLWMKMQDRKCTLWEGKPKRIKEHLWWPQRSPILCLWLHSHIL
jgi:hypothetical protein